MSSPEELDSDGAGMPASDRASIVSKLFREHNRALVSFLRARLRSEQEARDVAQEAYVRLLQLEDHKAVSFLRSYLFRIAANLAVDHLRQRAVREETRPSEIFDSIVDERAPDRIAMGRQEIAVVRQALVEMPESWRQTFVAFVFEGQGTTQIASHLGVSDRMVRIYLAQALAQCRARLDSARQSPQE